MRKLTKILGGLGLIVALAGCVDHKSSTKSVDITLSGTPISVSAVGGNHGGYISLVLDCEGKSVLAISKGALYLRSLSRIDALVQSEISDKDEEKIELTGNYARDNFIFNSVKANGYEVKF